MDITLSGKAKTLCRSLLPSPWCDLSSDDITIEPITTGRSNRLFICTRPSSTLKVTSTNTLNDCSSSVICSSSDDDSDDHCNGENVTFSRRSSSLHEHTKVIVRFYGSELTGEGNRYKCVSDDEEIEILTILATRSMSPVVLATFPGGRIDEYIESTTLLPKQLSQLDIVTIIASKIAQYHATPFKCERIYDLIQIFRDNSSQAIKILSNYDETSLPDRSETSIQLLRKIKNFFIAKPGEQLTKKVIETKQRTVFVHFDLNYTNFLFPKQANNMNTSKWDTMIIDVENSSNNYRGIDLGKFFAELCIGDGTQDLYYIPDSSIHTFIDSYLNEWVSIVDPNQIDPEIDNHDHLALELQLGFLFNTVFNMAWNVLHPNFGSNNFLTNTATRIDVFNHYNQLWSQIIESV